MPTYEETIVQYKNRFSEVCKMCSKNPVWRSIEWAYEQNIKKRRLNNTLMKQNPKANDPEDYILIRYCKGCREQNEKRWHKKQNNEFVLPKMLEDAPSGD